jgi:hypothetical protein
MLITRVAQLYPPLINIFLVQFPTRIQLGTNNRQKLFQNDAQGGIKFILWTVLHKEGHEVS